MNGVFDYSKSEEINLAKKLIHMKGGKVINLAHWIWMWDNMLRTDDMLEFDKKNETVGFFEKNDQCIIENDASFKVFRKLGLEKKNSHLIGSLRFSTKWINIRDKILPLKKVDKKYNSKKIKILFLK